MLRLAQGLFAVQVALAGGLARPVLSLSLVQPDLALDATALSPRFLLG
jgi:hypothetical protein